MTQKYKLIVLTFTTHAQPCDRELTQRIAFSHGYDWPGETLKGEVKNTCITCMNDLMFDPNRKSIHSISYHPKTYPNVSLTYSISVLNAFLKKPEIDAVIIKSEDGSIDAEITETSVRFCRGYTIDVPKELLDRINPPEQKGFPTVNFNYNHVNRIVEVIRMDADYIQGFEIMRNGVETERSFKKFCVDKVQSEVTLETFRPA